MEVLPGLVSIDFNAPVLLPACWGEPRPFCFSGLWDFLLGVQVKEETVSFEELQTDVLMGKGESGRDLKAVSVIRDSHTGRNGSFLGARKGTEEWEMEEKGPQVPL